MIVLAATAVVVLLGAALVLGICMAAAAGDRQSVDPDWSTDA